MIDMKPVLIMAGGTGGHVFPALAVASELRNRGVPVVWLGTKNGLEAKVVPDAGFPIQWIDIGGLRGKGVLAFLLAPVKLLRACVQAFFIIRKIKPCAVLGMGGFVSGPGGLMAWLVRKPLLIHEQNAVAGLTNKILAKIAKYVFVAFPDTFSKNEIQVGNPVRKEMLILDDPQTRLAKNTGALRLLVIGGSLGAVRLNELLPEAISKIAPGERPEIIHQAGLKNIHQAKDCYRRFNVEATIEAFIEDMAKVYSWADLVICRAGAMTVFELAAVGVASVLVPYPYAADDHQTFNGLYLVDAGAAILVQQKELNSEWLSKTITQLTQQRDRLLQMAKAARLCSKPDAANDVAQMCMVAGGIV